MLSIQCAEGRPALAITSRRRGNSVRTTIFSVGLFAFWAALCSLNAVLMKVVMDSGLSATALATMRAWIVTAVLLAVTGVVNRKLLAVRKADLLGLAAYGVVGLGLTSATYVWAISEIPIGVALVLQYLAPVIVTLWARIVWKRRIHRITWLGNAICLVGLALTAEPGLGGRLTIGGICLALVSGLCFAASFLFAESGLRARHPLTQVTWGYVFGSAAWIVLTSSRPMPWHAFAPEVRLPSALGAERMPTWLLVAVIATLGSAGASLVLAYGVRLIGAPRAGVLGMLEPVAGISIGWAVLGQTLSPLQLVGAGVALFGVVAAELPHLRINRAADATQELPLRV